MQRIRYIFRNHLFEAYVVVVLTMIALSLIGEIWYHH